MASSTKKKLQLNLWIIHAFRPFYRLINPLLDKDTKSLADAVENGTVDEHPKAKRMQRTQFAAESLEWSQKRENDSLWLYADENGDFILEDGELARQVMERLKNDPAPKAMLDELSPPLPEAPEGKKPDSQEVTFEEKTGRKKKK